jgi:glutamine amidotransferase
MPAKIAHSRTFLAHVRYASTGAHTPANTHPFAQDGRLFAHNGVIEDLTRLEHVTRARLSQIMDLLLLAPEIQERSCSSRMSCKSTFQ